MLSGLLVRRVLGASRARRKRAVHQHRQLADIVLRNVLLGDGRRKDVRQDHLQLLHVLAELRVGLGGEHGAHGRARGQVAARQVVDLQADVHGQLVDGVLDALQTFA